MALVVILEDVREVAERLVNKLEKAARREQLQNVRIEWVSYKNQNGRIRDVASVAASAVNFATEHEGPAAFVVDLAPETMATPPNTEYGLNVIERLAADLGQGSVDRLLQNPNHLTAVLTVYDGWRESIPPAWNREPIGPIEVLHVDNDTAIATVLNNRAERRLLPLCGKVEDEHWIVRMLIEWLKRVHA